jgi:hypothetical protein
MRVRCPLQLCSTCMIESRPNMDSQWVGVQWEEAARTRAVSIPTPPAVSHGPRPTLGELPQHVPRLTLGIITGRSSGQYVGV